MARVEHCVEVEHDLVFGQGAEPWLEGGVVVHVVEQLEASAPVVVLCFKIVR